MSNTGDPVLPPTHRTSPRKRETPPRAASRLASGARLSLAAALLLAGCGTEVEGNSPDETVLPASALLSGTAKRTRTIAALMFNISKTSGGAADPMGIPNATNITSVISGTGRSQRHMYQEASFGLQDIEADILGPYELPVANCLTIACCGPSSDKTGNGSTVASIIAGLPKKYDHYFWVYGKIPSGANCGTWGDEGAPNKPAVYSSYSFHEIVGYAQEIGHNFGMTHEPTLTCTGRAPFLDDTSQCTHVEYGSTLSFMGGGARHPSAYHKMAQGWIGGCNVVKGAGAGTYTLVPQELPCDGVQLLQVPAPKTRPAPAKGDRQGNGPMLSNYYLEMRAPYGFDTGLKPQVIISIGPGLPTSTTSAPYNYVLDLTPEARADLSNAGLMTVGQKYEDPGGGLTITLDAIDMKSATITITGPAAGSATCLDSSAFTAPGPDGASCGSLVAGAGGASGTPTGGSDGNGPGNATGGSGTATGGRNGGAGGRSSGTGGARGGTNGSGGVTATGGTTGLGGTSGKGGTGGPGNGSGGTSAGATGGGPATGGSTGGPGGASTPPGDNNATSGGCSCETAGASSGPTGLSFGLAVLATTLVRRRRRHARL